MGSLIHIAEVAALILVAYLVGWVAGYVLHRVAGRPAKATVVAAAAQPAPVATQPDDVLVKAPVVVPVAAGAPPHVHAKVTQIEPATTVAVPDGMILAEARSIDVPKVPPVPVSALESLKSLTTAIPLAPIELQPIVAPQSTSVRPTVAIADEAPVVVEAGPEPAIAAQVIPEAGPAAAAAAEPEAPEVPIVGPELPVEPAVEAAPMVPDAASAPGPAPTAAGPELATPLSHEPEPGASLAMPSNRPGVAWSGAIKGREASAFERIAEVAAEPDGQGGATSPPVGLDVSLLESLADELEVDEPALPVAELDQIAPATESNASPQVDAQAAEPVAAVEPASPADAFAESPAPLPDGNIVIPVPAVDLAVTTPEPAAGATAVPPPQFDEDAAMRAIEGGWSRRQTRAMSDAYELTDVSAAVSAAQVAVEQVLAAKGIDPSEQGARAQASFGKPKGLPHPRNHQRDNLRQINGLGPLDESSLNNLGIYHFDQIAAWDQKEVLWLENHAFARGRIGREDWQAQAQSLMVDSEAARRIGG